MQTIERFGLPKDYKTNPTTTNLQSGELYWDESRIDTSRAYQRAVYAWALQLIRQHKIGRVADVGCGFAAKLAWLHTQESSIEYYGIDQPGAIDLCRSHYPFGNWISVDIENNPTVPDVDFGLLIASDVIEHLQNPDHLLDYLRQVGKPGCLVLISTPDRVALRGEKAMHSPNPSHVREWSGPEFRAYVESKGFRVLEHRRLQAFNPCHSQAFARKALSHWVRGKSIRYNQAILAEV